MRANVSLGRVVLVLACIGALIAALAPAAQAARRNGGRKHYTVRQGPCVIESLPKGASHQWTPHGESIVHRVRYGQGLQEIAWSYGFKGDAAFRKLWDANPQLEAPWLERPGITIRIPACGAQLRTRTLPKPPPPPEPPPAPETDTVTAQAEAPAPTPAEPAPEPEPAPAVPSGSVWDRLAECESGGNWAINTGNGYYGGLQFSASSWAAVGGSGLPHEHSRAEQIKRGEMLQARQGWGAWPSCAAKLGLL